MIEAAAPSIVQSPAAPTAQMVVGFVPRRVVRSKDDNALHHAARRARPETVTNLFADLFTEQDPVPVQPPTARQRSRARIAALIHARETAAAPETRNLWHDAYGAPSDSFAGLAANDSHLPQDADHVNRIRTALYATPPQQDHMADVTARVIARKGQSVQMRLAVQAMNGTLIIVAAPVGAAVMTYSLIRGEDLRMTGTALAVCGALMAVIQTGLNFV